MPKLSSHLKKDHIYHLVLFKSSDLNCNAALSECALGGAAAIIKERFVAERTHTERKRRKLLFHILLGFGWKKDTLIKSRAGTIDLRVVLELKNTIFWQTREENTEIMSRCWYGGPLRKQPLRSLHFMVCYDHRSL